MNKYKFILVLLVLLGALGVSAGEVSVVPVEPGTLLGEAPGYVPRRTDYSLEIGFVHAQVEMFWSGALVGRHVGTCVFSSSETCQQYIDLIGGFAGREGEHTAMGLVSPRWQFVNFPARWSPYVRVFGGGASVNRFDERGWRGVGGGGLGLVTYLHERVDLRIEARAGYVDRFFAVGIIAAQFKVDRLLEYFQSKFGNSKSDSLSPK